MTKFHSDDYIKFLRSIRPGNMGEYSKLLQRFSVARIVQCSMVSRRLLFSSGSGWLYLY